MCACQSRWCRTWSESISQSISERARISIITTGKRSSAWQCFETVLRKGESCVVCVLCGKEPGKGTGTSGVCQHLQGFHPK